MSGPSTSTEDWSDDRVTLLKKLWADGLSAGDIANELGGVSRNAVIGKVHRLGLPGRRGEKPLFTTPSRTPAAKPERVKAFKPPREPAQPRFVAPPTQAATEGDDGLERDGIVDIAAEEIPAAQRCTLLELNKDKCHWPIGDPRGPDFFFCGGPTATRRDGKLMPYCASHCGRAFEKPRRAPEVSEEDRFARAIANRNRLHGRQRALAER